MPGSQGMLPDVLMFATVLLVTLAAGPSKADDVRARGLHERAAISFEARDYPRAAELWREAYAASRRPLFLYNVAQAIRRGADDRDDRAARLTQARAAYQEYLDASTGNEPERVDALHALLDIDRALATPAVQPGAGDPKPSPPPKSALEPAPTVLSPAAGVASSLERAPDVATSPPPWWKHPAFWISVGVAVAAGATIGVVAATSSSCRADLGCLDAR